MSNRFDALESRNPYDGALLETHQQHDENEIDGRLDAVSAAQRDWASVPVETRCERLADLAGALRSHKSEYAKLMTAEMGKPITQAEGEIEKCAWVCEYYAESAPSFLAPESVDTDAMRSEIVFRPLGNVFAIMPWNFPFWQAFRFGIPALAAGNGVVLKHASNVTGCALAIEAVCAEALSARLLSTVIMEPGRAAGVIEDARIAAVTFTGSTGAGRKVGEAAGRALKKCVLELGGSDPYVVLADADVAAAAEVCAKARVVNSGQSCIAAKRFIVEEAIAEEFEAELSRRFSALSVGDPMDPGTDVGPLARRDLVDTLARQVDQSVEQGARILAGGGPGGNGAFYVPTILTGVTPTMPAFCEELFGPVAPVIRAKNRDEAITLANRSEFGLGGAIFSAQADDAWQIACDRMETGTVAVNGQVQSDPRLPFGGIRHSGFGRELGKFGIREFVNVKTVSRFG